MSFLHGESKFIQCKEGIKAGVSNAEIVRNWKQRIVLAKSFEEKVLLGAPRSDKAPVPQYIVAVRRIFTSKVFE